MQNPKIPIVKISLKNRFLADYFYFLGIPIKKTYLTYFLPLSLNFLFIIMYSQF